MDLSTLSDDELKALYGQQSQPRGIRNNNPLNLKANVKWDGMAGQDGPFAVFDSPEAGVAAADRNLQTYGSKHGINSVSGVVGRWAPPNADGNHTANYISHVAQKVGVGPDDPIDLANPETRRALTGAMAEFENGQPVDLPAQAPDLSKMSNEELTAAYRQAAPPAAPKAPPQVPQVAPPQTRPDDRLGFLKGAFAPVDHASNWLEAGIRKMPQVAGPLAEAGAGLRKMIPQGAVDFIDNPKAYYDAQAAKGVRPGKLGEFAGNVAGTAFIPGGPLAQGALGGALLSEKKDFGGVAQDAAFGAVAGKVADKALKGAGSLANNLLGKGPKVMKGPELKAAVRAAYDKVDNSGFSFPKADVKALVDDFAKTVSGSALSKSAKDDAASIIQYARTLAKGDLPLSQLEKLRGDIYTAMVKKGGDTGMVGNGFRAKIDALMDASGNGLVRDARALNARLKKYDYVSNASKSADRAAERTYGGDYGRKVKDRLNPLVDEMTPNRNLRGATPDERAALEKIVRGTKTQNVASTVGGMLDPRRLGGKILSSVTAPGGGLGAPATGGLSLLVPAAQMGAGFALTGKASSIARKNVDELLKLIAAGGSRQALKKQATPAGRAAQRALGKVPAGLIGAGLAAQANDPYR